MKFSFQSGTRSKKGKLWSNTAVQMLKLPMMQLDRAVAKADRHIEELNKARENASATPASPQVPTEAGLPEQAQAATSSVSSIDSQISDAKDNRADAVAQLNKAQAQLDAATVLEYTRRDRS